MIYVISGKIIQTTFFIGFYFTLFTSIRHVDIGFLSRQFSNNRSRTPLSCECFIAPGILFKTKVDTFRMLAFKQLSRNHSNHGSVFATFDRHHLSLFGSNLVSRWPGTNVGEPFLPPSSFSLHFFYSFQHGSHWNFCFFLAYSMCKLEQPVGIFQCEDSHCQL